MTAHMIQPPDQVDDIIQRDYNMSQFPTDKTLTISVLWFSIKLKPYGFL